MTDYIVTGAAAVLPLKAGSERYVYRGGIVSSNTVTAAGIKHALSLDLIEEMPDVEDLEAAAAEAQAQQALAAQAAFDARVQEGVEKALAERAAAEKKTAGTPAPATGQKPATK